MTRLFATALAVAVFALGTPRARACGGFFCSTVPVIQIGEQIVYVLHEDGSLTMSVQIRYAGSAPDFAWILPVPETPEISLGTDAFFSTIEPATQPSFSIRARTEGECREAPRCEYSGPRAISLPDAGSAGPLDAAPRADAGGPTLFAEGSLGPYETVVIGGTSATEIHDWLAAHGYDLPASSVPLLDAYVATGQRFVALRLRPDAASSDIQPITLDFEGVLPCLPIRLTAIATSSNLPITAYFLAGARVVPRNYSLVGEPDDPALWLTGLSYTAWVTGAVDALGGRAFATDFAGATPIVSLELEPIDSLAAETNLHELVRALVARGYGDAPTLGVLARFVTPPAGVDARAYAQCLLGRSGSELCGMAVAFDAPAIVAALEEAVGAPRRAAAGWLRDRPYLTRLYTTMSASDMTLDPEFVVDEGLPDVERLRRATLVTECDPRTFADDARVRLDMPGGRSAEISPRRTSPSDAAWCAARGARLAARPGGGGACSARGALARSRWAPWLSVIAVAAARLTLRRRRARAPTAAV